MKQVVGLEKMDGYPRSRVRKAVELFKSGAVERAKRAGESLYFNVKSNQVHEVIYRIPINQFLCDCRHFALKDSHCSHILAVRLFLENVAYSQSEKS